MKRLFPPKFALALALGLALTSPLALAQDDDDSTTSSDDWMFSGSVYGWFPDIGGRTNFSEGPGGGSIDVPVSDILDNLEFTFQGSFMARKGRWGVFADLIYLDLSNTQALDEDEPRIGDVDLPIGVTGTVGIDMTSWIVTTAATYRLGDDGEGRRVFDLLAGARYMDIDQTLELSLEGDLGMLPIPGPQSSTNVSEGVFDFIIGMRGRIAYTDDGSWFTPYYFDVGTGDSDITWQGMVGVGYEFGWGDVVLAYRILDYDMPSDKPIDTLDYSGPALGAVFHW
ncbi:MAG: hypothetical protein AAGH19_02760 [Pseudomonadota bacterium]